MRDPALLFGSRWSIQRTVLFQKAVDLFVCGPSSPWMDWIDGNNADYFAVIPALVAMSSNAQ